MKFMTVILFSIIFSYSSIDSTVVITEYRVNLWPKFYKPEFSKDSLSRAFKSTYSYFDNGMVSQIITEPVFISLTIDESGFINSVKESDLPDPQWPIFEHKFGEKGEELSVVSFTSGGFDSSISEKTWYADDSLKYTTYSKKGRDQPFVKSIEYIKLFRHRKSRAFGFWTIDSGYVYDSNHILVDKWVNKFDSVGNTIYSYSTSDSGKTTYEIFTKFIYDGQNRVIKQMDSTIFTDGIERHLSRNTTVFQYFINDFVSIKKDKYQTFHYFYIYKNTMSIRRKIKRPLSQNGLYLLLNKYNINGARKLR